MTLLMSFALSFLGSVATAKENVRATQVPRVIAQDNDPEEMPIEESDNEAARLDHQKSESESAEEPEASSASDASDQPLSIDELNVDETTESFEFLEEGKRSFRNRLKLLRIIMQGLRDCTDRMQGSMQTSTHYFCKETMSTLPDRLWSIAQPLTSGC